MRERTQTLETNLANVMIAELASHQPPRRAPDSDDRFPLIEILRDAAFGADDLATTRKLPPRGVWIDTDDTVPHALYSSPYERVDVGVEIAPSPPRRARKRPATISRVALAQRLTDSAATTRKLARFSAPYERIEIEHAVPTAVTSGTFEAAWFMSPDDVIDGEPEASPIRSQWIWIAASALAAAAVVVAWMTL